jgi:hypothetical protein
VDTVIVAVLALVAWLVVAAALALLVGTVIHLAKQPRTERPR